MELGHQRSFRLIRRLAEASGGAGRGRPIEVSSLADTSRQYRAANRNPRVRPRNRRRPCAGLRHPDRRRPRYQRKILLLQVGALGKRNSLRLHHRRRSRRSSADAGKARLGVEQAPVSVAAATNLSNILATLDAPDGPDLVVIDSIRTMYIDALDSAPGTVAQVRASAQGIDPFGRETRLRLTDRWTRHEGRCDCRAPGARTYGRYGPLFRRRARPSVSDPAGG